MSPRAAWRLETLGFTSVYEYAAGKADWGAYGLPVEGTVTKVPPIQQLARTDVTTCRLSETIPDVRARLGTWTTGFGLRGEGNVLGRPHQDERAGDPNAVAGVPIGPGSRPVR